MTPLGVAIPEHDRSELKLLWSHGYWDGPLNGVALYKGRKVWFSADDAFEHDERLFNLYEMTSEELQQREQIHADFCQYVGNHCDYDLVTQKRNIGALKPQSEWHKFYDKYSEAEK